MENKNGDLKMIVSNNFNHVGLNFMITDKELFNELLIKNVNKL